MLTPRPRRWMNLALGLFSSASLHCTTPRLATSFDACEPTQIVLSDDVSEERGLAIAAGLAQWTEPLSLPWSVVRGAATVPVALPARFIATEWFFGRYADEEGALIFSTSVGDPEKLAIVAAHEIGHAMGLYHVDADTRGSVMNPGNLTQQPTQRDLDDIVSLWGRCEGGMESAPSAAAVP